MRQKRDGSVINRVVSCQVRIVCEYNIPGRSGLMLKNACDAFDELYFREHYSELETINQNQMSIEEFILTLKRLDGEIGEGSNLGEIKEYVLIQWLNIRSEDPVFYFCSDDRNARNGVLSVEVDEVQCVSVVSAFHWLKTDGGLTKETAQPFINSALQYYNMTKQASVRVIEASTVGRFMRIPYQQAFDEIFKERFIRLPNGMLKYWPDSDP